MKDINATYTEEEISKILEENRFLKSQLSNKENSNIYEFGYQDSNKSELEQFRFTFMNAPATICILKGEKHKIIFANENYKKLYGNRKLIGTEIRESHTEIQGQGFFELLDEVYKTGIQYIGNEHNAKIYNNGILEESYFNFVYQPTLNFKNEVDGVMIFAFNVTEQVLARKKLEEITQELIKSESNYKLLNESLELQINERTRDLFKANKENEFQRTKFEALFMNAPAGIAVVYGDKYVYEFSNPIYESMFGNRKYINNSFENIFPEFKDKGIYELFDNVFKTGKSYKNEEFEYYIDKDFNIYINPENKEGLNQRFCNFTLQPILGENIMTERIAIFVFDNTQQVLARKKIEELSKELERSNSDLKNFALVASHDLQEPLRTIEGYTKLLEKRYKDKFDDNAKEFINTITDASKRMQILIRNLLEYSKVDNKSKFKLVNLNKIIDDIKSSFESKIKENKATINYHELPTIKCVDSQIYQLMQNFISNSLKYRKDESPIINISATKEENFWHLKISDNGIGIEKEYYEKIFVIFKRLHTSEQFEGTGIGLATVKKIVDIHKGKIWVESDYGIGSTFHILIPA